MLVLIAQSEETWGFERFQRRVNHRPFGITMKLLGLSSS